MIFLAFIPSDCKCSLWAVELVNLESLYLVFLAFVEASLVEPYIALLSIMPMTLESSPLAK